jgi:uncharacterized OsmC-like protein
LPIGPVRPRIAGAGAAGQYESRTKKCLRMRAENTEGLVISPSMGELVDTVVIRVYKDGGKDKRAYIDNFPEPIKYGLRGGIKNFFGIKSGADLPTTLDHLVATIAGCMTGTLGSALEARGVPSHPEKLSAEVEGRVENIDGKPLLTGIIIRYKIKVPKQKRADAQRAVDHHDKGCAVSQSVRRGFTIEWEAEIAEE